MTISILTTRGPTGSDFATTRRNIIEFAMCACDRCQLQLRFDGYHLTDSCFNSQLVERRNAIANTVERACHYGDIARDALAIFPDSEHKAALTEAVDFCVARAY